jgi:DNA-binding response OmpR family regulator
MISKPGNSAISSGVLDPEIILVVEDDASLLGGIRDILKLHRFQVLTASDGKEALNLLQNQRTLPNLIVSDIMMPGMNGFEFCEAVRSQPQWANIPFIFLTARNRKVDLLEAKSLGADDYVTKPFAADDLVVAVKARLARQNSLTSSVTAVRTASNTTSSPSSTTNSARRLRTSCPLPSFWEPTPLRSLTTIFPSSYGA